MDDRKKRLAALAARAGRKQAAPDEKDANEDNADDAKEDNTSSPAKKDVKFRNYTPSDKNLLKKDDAAADEVADTTDSSLKKRARPSDADANNTGTSEEPPKKKKSALEEALEQAKKDLSEENLNIHDNSAAPKDFAVIAPKKINEDLKRGIQPKLDKLEKRTQKAIVQMLRERLSREADAAAEEDDGNEEPEEELD